MKKRGWVLFDLAKEGNVEKEKEGNVRAYQTSNLPKIQGEKWGKRRRKKVEERDVA